jgi:hypothetical protein
VASVEAECAAQLDRGGLGRPLLNGAPQASVGALWTRLAVPGAGGHVPRPEGEPARFVVEGERVRALAAMARSLTAFVGGEGILTRQAREALAARKEQEKLDAVAAKIAEGQARRAAKRVKDDGGPRALPGVHRRTGPRSKSPSPSKGGGDAAGAGGDAAGAGSAAAGTSGAVSVAASSPASTRPTTAGSRAPGAPAIAAKAKPVAAAAPAAKAGAAKR